MEVVTKLVDKSELEKMLVQTYGDKLNPMTTRKTKRTGMSGFYEQINRPHRICHKLKDGRVKIKEIDGSVRWE